MRRVIYTFGLALLWSSAAALRAYDKPGDAEEGKEVYGQCAGCHDAGTSRKRGPGLKGLFSKERMSNGKKPTEETVLEQINEGSSRMPGFKDVLSEREKKHLIAYLKTL